MPDSTLNLYTFWLPMVSFSKVIENIDNYIEKNKDTSFVVKNRKVDYIQFTYDKQSIIIDALGFFYIESDKKDKFYNCLDFLTKILSNKTKEIIEITFLNENITCNKEKQENTLLSFLENIYIEFSNINDIVLQSIQYQLLNQSDNRVNFTSELKSQLKFTLKQEAFNKEKSPKLRNIINRNITHLIEKSIFYTHALHYEDSEVYNLSIFSNEVINKLVIHLNLIIQSNDYTDDELNKEEKDILQSVIKKAIQDSIEEETLLQFLKQTKSKYLTKIFDKISKVNEGIEKLHSQILAIYNIKNDNEDTCTTGTEEDIELFIQKLLQVIPKFNVIDTKIRNAYYIKIGNVTTSTQIHDSESIVHTLFYEKWKSAIDYFEEMAMEIKEILTIYHQNKSIKELENIAYYENYKSDLDDIKDIQEKSYSLAEHTRNYLDKLVLFIAITALAGEAPILNIQSYYGDKNITISGIKFQDALPSMTINFMVVFINVLIYGILAIFIYFVIIKNWDKISKFFSTSTVSTKYFFFDESDYDKHEHRSSKPISTINNNENSLTVSYNEIDSAYSIMKKLKNIKIKKSIERKNSKTEENMSIAYPLFPKILQKPYSFSKESQIRENYRISRTDKANIKILFRYKITKFALETFLDEFKNDKEFIKYYKSLNTGKDILNIVKIINEKIRDSKNEIKLNLYVVYSFNLKFKQHNNAEYSYTVMKDQFRVHYHINKLPYTNNDDLEKSQEHIANLIYIYFLARLKNFDYLNKSNKNDNSK